MASNDTPKTVELYGYGCQHEAQAHAAITPGMLVERATVSGSFGVQAHATAGGPGNMQFAVENGMVGRGIGDDYAADDQVIFKTYQPGSGVYALLATANDITAGDLLASNGDGSLKAADLDEVAVAQAMEDLNNTSGSASRLKVEVVSAHRTNP